mgnify:CR=1 FL=1
MRIRKASARDIPEVAGVLRSELAKAPYNEKLTQRQAESAVRSIVTSGVMFVAEDRTIIGLIIAERYIWYRGPRIWVSALFIDSDHQGKGIGRKLLERVQQHYKNATGIELLAHRDASANIFYTKLGFRKSKYAKLEKSLRALP